MKSISDPIFFIILAALLISGLIILTSASVTISQKKFHESYYYVKHQLLNGVLVGLIGFFLVQKIYYRNFKKLALFLLFLSIILLLLVFVPSFGLHSGGAKRWISFYNYSFQPAELLKLTFIIYLASWLESRKKEIHSFFFSLMPFWLMMGIISALLILQPDIGTLILITLIAIIMYALGGGRASHILLTILIGFIILLLVIQFAPYRLNRILSFFSPDLDKLGISYQINQATIGIGSGGLLGLGLGQSRLKYGFLPETMGDSIFAIAAEELGFVGSVFIIFLFFMFVWRTFKIAKNTTDTFGRLLAIGIGSWIGLQAFINIAAISGLIPLTGIPLPFISYGGSSLAINLIASGIILNIAKYN